MIRMAKFKFFFEVLVMGALLSCCRSQGQDNCLNPDNRWVRIGGMDLRLRCPCRRPPEAAGNFRVQWYRLVGGRRQLLHTEMGVDRLTIPVNSDSVGGIYLCECSPCHRQFCGKCFRVGVNPTIIAFTIQPRIARVGESLSLNCSAIGHPAPRYEITKMGSNPNIPVGSNYEEIGVLTISNATLSTGGSYTCLVLCWFDHENVSRINIANANVTIYDPPKVVWVTNDTVVPGRDSVASLLCYVENTTLTHVAWFRGSKELHQSSNYSFSAVVVQEIENRSMVRFLLTVHIVSESDSGEYRCRVGSPYNSSEDEALVWIQYFLPPSPIPTSREPPIEKDENYTGVAAIGGVCGVVALFIVTAIVAVVGVRAFIIKKDSRRQLEEIDEQNNMNSRNDANTPSPSPLEATATTPSENGGVITQENAETTSITSASHDGNNMSLDNNSFSSSSSTLPGNRNSSADLLASPNSTVRGHFVTAACSNGGTSGQFEELKDPAKTIGLKLPPPDFKGLHRRALSLKVIGNAQNKKSVSPHIRLHSSSGSSHAFH